MRSDLADTLARHAQWLHYNEEVDTPLDAVTEAGKSRPPRGERAVLSDASLDGLLLPGKDFSGAIMLRASMIRANFARSNFTGADLRDTDLRGANLSATRLNEADLRCADLRGASLTWANLQFAKMDGVKLAGANICYAVGDGRYIKNLHPTTPDGWWLTYTSSQMSIGCQQRPLWAWREGEDAFVRNMAPAARRLWKINKAPIFAALEAFPAEEHD